MLLKKLYLISTVLVLFSVFFVSCKPKTNVQKNISAEILIEADKKFSELSKQVGMKKAFIEYIDQEGILLRPNHAPIIGADAIDFLSQVNDSAFTLTWQPGGGEISQSDDMGFTYGVYNLELKDTVLKGTYVSIWKKQKDGKWKFVLDSGNEGIAEK